MAKSTPFPLGLFGQSRIRLWPKDQLLFWVYLLQLETLPPVGIVHYPLPLLAGESYGKFTEAECRDWLIALQQDGRLLYDHDWLWLIEHFLRVPPTETSYASAARALEQCESRLIFDAFLKKYGQLDAVKGFMAGLRFSGDARDGLPTPTSVPSIPPIPVKTRLIKVEVERVWTHYQHVCRAEDLRLTDLRRSKILQRLRDYVRTPEGGMIPASTDHLLFAIDNIVRSDVAMGRLPGLEKHCSLERDLFVSKERFQYWLDFQSDDVKPAPAEPFVRHLENDVPVREAPPAIVQPRSRLRERLEEKLTDGEAVFRG